ncbi:MAG: hypothetical protein A3A96_03040 [Candidatus Zambryskibacteria bacterium RIFCSPLOWO2_01_FULL_39_39]|uniref:Uncharacterized protein n=1 Tax=Candidatus Zambryskibacteria bacterium RIFCSPLOWO2_01_FULL_39_39 TaxID=1802758 RepID=A0A1G2TWB0_9BACT|nr:MAG: hypothetical protein UT00_C0002G0017 [Parcubacteria group bacterium GW2011_GWA1_38_7]OHA87635.1 MAG: hypothetical protein A2644_02430 [Candidatus Zambryskibacteria bacterium RIFCSPHIGHO2_01_FULL_39_63]OHA94429.1 MAG: hypothetical protein A3B88_01885 [Candidatus Zambryskibacteria bacterium RIFCSPHIGHO2_02_FULL_39_19]OHA98759.1 MAG: hypothetical protein A3F20_00725 [Candidatus Zambryskibacteria bacterium RIFCSPHIGHO2_12_FULL_39_21]OHB01618.1 MAG: hypothetical protein A3A96_03040 [Candidat
MKTNILLAFVATLLAVLAGGCATTQGGGGGWGRLSSLATPPILTVVLTNNTNVPLEVFENGQPISIKGPDGQWHGVVLPSGNTVSRGYYNFLGRRDVVITVRGICPSTPPESDTRTAGCTPGQYAGTASRSFYIYTDGQWRTDFWEIDYLRGPRGVY